MSLNIYTSPVSAAVEAVKWTKVNIPAEGEAGGWVLANGSDVQHLTSSADGTLYAYGAGLTYTLLKSTDGGLRWTSIGKVQDAIVDIAVSPIDPRIFYYATAANVYRSIDGGKTFIVLPSVPGAGAGNVEITAIAAGWLNGTIIAVSTKDMDGGEYGGVYLFDEAEVIPAWTDASIGNFDVYAVAFSPDYAEYRQIIAVATDETESYVFNKIADSGWDTFFSRARLRDNSDHAAAVTVSADIAFTGNYRTVGDSAESSFYVGINTGTGGGDVYKVTLLDTPESSTSIDLNAGGPNGLNNVDITSLSVNEESGNTIILAGAANGQTVISTDGGTTWIKSKKAPTGVADAYVLIPPDFFTSRTMYAATSGAGSAFSVSRDMGLTWNQVSLIDTAILNLADITPSPDYARDKTLFITTQGGGPGSTGIWRTTNDAVNWERIFSTANTGVDVISRMGLPPQYGPDSHMLFVAGESNGNTAIWSSEDNGQSFRVRFTRAALSIDDWVIKDETSILVSYFDGSHGLICNTVNKGFSFSEGVPAGDHPIQSIAFSPDFASDGTILAGNIDGEIFRSGDGGASFTPLPAATSSGALSGALDVIFDPDFKENRNIYASSNTPGAGIYRFDIDKSEEWERIDSTLPAGAVIDRLIISGEGALYAENSNANGGIERCLDPKAANPVFETVTRGQSAGAIFSLITQNGHRLWAIDTVNCKLMTYEDTLTAPVSLTSPEDNISGIGGLTNHAVKNITIDWEPATGATGYQWQCDFDGDFSNIPAGLQGTVSGSSVHLPPLDPAVVYRWRVRVNAPTLSPWSETRSFTTSLDTEAIVLKPESPAAGATGVPIRPIFQWTAVLGASAYELLAASDTDFSNPVIIKINDYALPSNAWECDVSLDYATTYYWKTRAITSTTHSAWSSTGVFTTLPAPLDEKTPETKPEVRLLDSQDPMMNLPPAKNTPVFPPPAAAPILTPLPVPTTAAAPNQLSTIPDYIIYFIGGLLAIVMLSLVIILAVVLKIRRF